MLWHKSWLETRWRFVIGLAILMCTAAVVVIFYPRIAALIPLVPQAGGGGEVGRQIREAAELSRDYRGYVWSQWWRQNVRQTGTLFAVLLGSGGLIAQSSSGALFTLSLPVSRNRIVAVRAATGLIELFTIVFASTLLLPLLSPSVGESYSLWNALAHALCAFVAAAAFFSLAFLLSSGFGDIWRPLLLTLAVAIVLGMAEPLLREMSAYGIFGLMSGETVFRAGQLPLIALVLAASASAAMVYAAMVTVARQDF